ncbi:hypothetical protein F5880DRAFT_1505644 [Lentinula raphanica]|nr:hypothetical protein F5880DRAFT_1505644 [Lentinula raphanica]
MSLLDNLTGLRNVIKAFGDEPYSFAEQAADDMDAEKEASYIPGPSAAEDEEMDVLDDPPTLGLNQEPDDEDKSGQSNTNSMMDATGLREVLNEASKGVSQDTAADYRRQALCLHIISLSWLNQNRIMNKSEDFLVKRGLITKGQLFISPPHEDSAEMIVAVITPVAVETSQSSPISLHHSFAK